MTSVVISRILVLSLDLWSTDRVKIVSWNVNGIRASYKKGLEGFVRSYKPDILCLQETKAHPEQVGPEISQLAGLSSCWASATKKGYSGVATFWKNEPKSKVIGLGIEEFDSEGRVVVTDHEDFLLYNIYFPNGQSREERQIYKMQFNRALQKQLADRLKQGREIVVVGDYNIAPTAIDIHDPERFANTSGFLPEEREWFQQLLDSGFVDTFRHFNPKETERYSYWSQIERARISNRGWRIDMICVSKGLVKRLKSADILDHIEGSDHCPIVVEL